MAAKHTAGPWVWDYFSDGQGGLARQLVSESAKRGTVRIAVDLESEADRNLIAAAPDLLAAVEALFENAQPDGWDPAEEPWWQQALDAIKKSKGLS